MKSRSRSTGRDSSARSPRSAQPKTTKSRSGTAKKVTPGKRPAAKKATKGPQAKAKSSAGTAKRSRTSKRTATDKAVAKKLTKKFAAATRGRAAAKPAKKTLRLGRGAAKKATSSSRSGTKKPSRRGRGAAPKSEPRRTPRAPQVAQSRGSATAATPRRAASRAAVEKGVSKRGAVATPPRARLAIPKKLPARAKLQTVGSPVPTALGRLQELLKSRNDAAEMAAAENAAAETEKAALAVADPAAGAEPAPGSSPRVLPVGVRRGRLLPRDERMAEAPASSRSSDFDRVRAQATEVGLSVDIEQARSFIGPWLDGTDVLAFVPNDSHAIDAVAITEQVLRRRVLIIVPTAEAAQQLGRRLRQHGIRVSEIDQHTEQPERVLESVKTQAKALVLLGFAMLDDPGVFAALQHVAWDGVILDEAQRVSELAHDFDIAYDRFAELLPRLGRPATLALLRAAPPSVRSDLPHRLGLRNPLRVDLPPIREGVVLEVLSIEPPQRNAQLIETLGSCEGSRVVLCSSPTELDEVQGVLVRAGLRGVRFDDPLSYTTEREGDGQPIWLAVVGQAPHVGMAAVLSVHYRAPASLEQYCRDLIWLSRDTSASRSVVLVGADDEAQARLGLERLRARPEEVVGIAGVIARHGAGGTTVLIDAICPAVGLNRARVVSLVSLLVRAGWIDSQSDWVRLRPDCSDLVDRARGLSARLRMARDRDGNRMRSVAAYVISRGCRQETLRRHFGTATSRPCGLCDSCRNGGRHGGGRTPADAPPTEA